MSTIRMVAPGSAYTGSLTLPYPSLAVVAVTGGVGSVNAQDVPVALLNGWTIMAGENWPGAKVAHLTAPAGGAWPTSGTLTLPDNSTVAISGGAAIIPIAWVSWLKQQGWFPTPAVSYGE